MTDCEQMTLTLDLDGPGHLAPSDYVESLSREHHATASDTERGAIFTKTEVVDLILDLVGYTSDCNLLAYRLLEPSFGHGDFLFPAISRLLIARERSGAPWEDLENCIVGIEANPSACRFTYDKLIELLVDHGATRKQALHLADTWLNQDDFLLTSLNGLFSHAIGNPPYVRQELIPDDLLGEYRTRYSTMYDRADLYVAFYERSLRHLKEGGHLGFICADRWMKNKYGGPLRQLVSESFHLAHYIDMVDTPAFNREVIAYPAITVITRERGTNTCVAERPEISATSLGRLAKAMLSSRPSKSSGAHCVRKVANGSEPWVLHDFEKLNLVRRLEQAFPPIEDIGCKVGIGVATGADRAYIGSYDALDVEEDRKLPLATTRDIGTGQVKWQGKGVINPFADDGKLVDLAHYPRLAAYLEEHRDVIASRNVAKRNPTRWFRTIDRIYPALARQPKLLIPDIKGEAQVVYEEGRLYPHHNLYYIASNTWDIRALQAVLLGGIARLFVSIYSTTMRGGFLRYQAQYLRRIRLPRWEDVSAPLQKRLTQAGTACDQQRCLEAVVELYNLSDNELAATMEGM